MRIISGRFKGRKLVSFEADNIRPTTDRVKETLFNILQGHWDGARVLDLFSGTGNLSFEALSRGAREVDAVESHRKSLDVIVKNQNLLKVEEGFRLHRQDVFRFLQQYRGKPYDVVLADPPFTEEIAHDVMTAIEASSVAAVGTVIAIESRKQERMDDAYGRLGRIDTRDYGDKLLSLFTERSSHEKP